jgi:hypothetical protein
VPDASIPDLGQGQHDPLPSDTSIPSVLLKLSTKGAVTLPTRTATSPFRPIRSRGASVSDAVREDREGRF